MSNLIIHIRFKSNPEISQRIWTRPEYVPVIGDKFWFDHTYKYLRVIDRQCSENLVSLILDDSKSYDN